METIELTLPEYWACALVNGDFSGLSKEEEQEIEEFFECGYYGHCFGVSDEPFFTNWHDAGRYGADCLVYTFESLD